MNTKFKIVAKSLTIKSVKIMSDNPEIRALTNDNIEITHND